MKEKEIQEEIYNYLFNHGWLTPETKKYVFTQKGLFKRIDLIIKLAIEKSTSKKT